MPEHLRSLIVIAALAITTFWWLRPLTSALGLQDADFVKRRNLWFLLTLVAFLASNYWVYVLVTGAILLFGTTRKPAARGAKLVALGIAVALVAPPAPVEIPGIPGIRYLFNIDHLRLVSLTCLLPVLLTEMRKNDTRKIGALPSDYFVIAYLLLPSLLQFTVDSTTNTLRGTFERSLDLLVPYLAVSRAIKTRDDLLNVASSFAIAMAILAPIGIFEAVKGWLLYSSLPPALGIQWSFGSYLARGEGGDLRALASTGHSIALGYALAVGLFVFLGTLRVDRTKPGWRWQAVVVAFLAAIFLAKARGPWAGLAAGIVAYALTGPNPAGDLAKLLLGALGIGGALLLTPYADKLIALIPFIGTVDNFNVEYRQVLIDIGVNVVLANPLLGAFDFIYSPAFQSLRQGEGIIDIVNTYLGIALSMGLIGLSLFVGAFVAGLAGALRTMQHARRQHDTPGVDLGRGIVAALACILVTIFTVSTVTVIGFVYWAVLGLCAGYVHALRPQAARTVDHSASKPAPAAPTGRRIRA